MTSQPSGRTLGVRRRLQAPAAMTTMPAGQNVA
jgi:hypothetical protein